ncbi:MAG: hypothetical protein A2784_02795 [Candidatus Chisholmbacteria bacterium RIFCSPHIGHO2_01_FULL_48_12]|uniref:Uncharacterized protein n=1 Tax=Candidatus Chisholmbacteria bacterium RIFCSPHIGHO2_01_FULL_48_12 TaxID=1797589 RepID=A0A1G1VQ90_9BACT|nr:MAG: hypothetical protein A2784_02795 [Candidatus Chisholmbacteria bacterium RIFCSPHIGHO2_01_FULL_48_12]
MGDRVIWGINLRKPAQAFIYWCMDKVEEISESKWVGLPEITQDLGLATGVYTEGGESSVAKYWQQRRQVKKK